jgi:FkbM family methyltransferase
VSDYLYRFRECFHPLNYLRRHAFSRNVLRVMDIPIWTKLPGVDWRVRVRLVRHASAFLLPGGIEPGIMGLFSSIAREIGIRTFWDIGANMGYYAWLVKSLSPGTQVRMFEPDPDNVWLVQQTLRQAGLTGMVVREVAVSEVQGAKRFERDMIAGSTGNLDSGGDTFSSREWHAAAEPVIVSAVTMDDERSEQAYPVDLIKIDVEGHEEAVVHGGRGTIEKDQPILIFECFHGGGEITEYLSRIGYWIGDAERMSDELDGATNFLALPPRHRPLLDRLRQSWSADMSRFSGARAPHRTVIEST